jgi:putative chitinase
MITDTQLHRVMPNLPAAKLQQVLPHLNQAMQDHGVDTMLRTAAFVAQLAHESGEFRFMEELWGPTEAQKRYEPPSELATRLGNTEPGDGKRYKGRGPIQITGRFNYRKYGDLLGVDLIDHPEVAAQPEVAFETAGLYWERNGLNELADSEQFVAITRRINGGTNGLPDREKYYARAKTVLGDDFIAADFTLRGAPRARPLAAEPLPRGHEAIVELTTPAARKTPRKSARARRTRSQPMQL